MWLSYNIRVHTTQRIDTPEVRWSGSGEQGTLYYRVLQDLFFMRPLLPRAKDLADIPNTQKQTQGVR